MALPVSTAGGNNVAANVTVNNPSSWLSGNILVCVTCSANGATSALSLPTGWTSLQTPASPTGSSTTVYASIAYIILSSAGPSSYTFTTNSGIYNTVCIAEYSSVSAVDASAANVNNAGSSTATFNAVTTSSANEDVLLLLATSANQVSGSWPTGFTQEITEVASAVNAYTYIADAVQTSAGSTGTKTVTLAGSDFPIGFTVALTPKSSTIPYRRNWRTKRM